MTDRELIQLALDALITAELDGNCEYGATDLLRARLAQPPKKLELPLVRVEEFVKLIKGKESFRGIPVYRTEWPTPETVAKFEFQEYGPPNWGDSQAAQPEPEELAQLEQAMIEAWKPIPQREWVGLTDEEAFDAFGFNLWPESFLADVTQEMRDTHEEAKNEVLTRVRAIESKLREKNETNK